MPLKPALSIKDQLGLLQKRGMIINDESVAAPFLESNQYYRLNIYFHKLMDSPDHFRIGTNFSQVMAIYENDYWLRNRLMTILEPIEIRSRAQIAYYLGMKYGSDAFYQRTLYKDPANHQKILDSFDAEVNRNHTNPVVVHHQSNYGG